MTDEAANLIVEQLKLLRSDVKGVEAAVDHLRQDVDDRLDRVSVRIEQTNARIDDTNEGLELANKRLEVVETVVRDSSEQLVVLARGVHTLLQNRRNVEGELDELKRRVTALESR